MKAIEGTTIVAVAERAAALVRLRAVLTAFVLGASLLYGVGFAGADVLHNAAHDSRHGLSFPCH